MKVRCGSHRTTNFLQLRTWWHGIPAKWELTSWALWGIVLIQIDLWESHLLWRSHYWVNPFEYIRVWLNPRSLPVWEFPAFNIPGFTCSGISSFQCTCYTWLGISSFQYTWVTFRYTCFPGQCESTRILISDLGDTPLIYSALTWHCPRKLLASDKSFLISNSSEICCPLSSPLLQQPWYWWYL